MPQIRQRTAIIIPNEHESIEDVAIKDNSLILPIDHYPLQEKYTIPISLINDKLRFLSGLKSIRIQWSSFQQYDKFPLSSEIVPSGLNVYFLPIQDESLDYYMKELIDSLKQIFGIDFNKESLVLTPTSAHYYLPIDSIPSSFILQISELLKTDLHQDFSYLCRCDNFDIKYENGSDNLIAQFYFSDYSSISDETIIINEKTNYKHEIGIFNIDSKLTSVDSIGLTGVRLILDSEEDNSSRKDKRFHKTLFHLTPRHRTHQTKISSSIGEPVGLHPKLEFSFDETLESPSEHCQLYYYQLLPKSFFIDKYNLPKPINPIGIWGDTDLESPEYSIKNWGSEYLFEINDSNISSFDMTIHSRYQLPTEIESETHSDKVISLPVFFYACDESEISKDYELLSKSSFDSKFLGYESFFTEYTSFYHLDYHKGSNLSIGIPQLSGNLNNINFITGICLFLGIGYLFVKLSNVFRGDKK